MRFNYHNPYEMNETTELFAMMEVTSLNIAEIREGLEYLIELQHKGEITDYGQEDLLMEWEKNYRQERFERQNQGVNEIYDQNHEDWQDFIKKTGRLY